MIDVWASWFELHRAGGRVAGMPDPGGGQFGAAGDFDTLLPAACCPPTIRSSPLSTPADVLRSTWTRLR
jgi:hypothetical protein